MMDNIVTAPSEKVWLVSQFPPMLGIRHLVGAGTTRVGRSPDNEVVIQGRDAASVSQHHLEIFQTDNGFRIRDLGSTNGTYLNGERISEAELSPPATIRLGAQGPELAFTDAEPPADDLDQTLAIGEGASLLTPDAPLAASSGEFDALLSEAVTRARQARISGFGDQTMGIMRETLHRALRHTGRRFRLAIGILATGLLSVSALALWKISALKQEKIAIDRQIQEIEKRLQTNLESPAETDRLISQLNTYQNEAQQLRQNLLYRVTVKEKEGFLAQEIRTLMAEFGAEVYSIPPDFIQRVDHYINQYQGSDRPLIEQALGSAAPRLRIMRNVLETERLPLDLAYIPLVESALAADESSAAGAAGFWQLTPATAKAYGLRVDKQVDERLNLTKATRAACRYLRELILDFGTGSSVMLALAAYNSGPTKVKQAILKTVQDPIKQRSFWYLYRARALPAETREYVPKVVAAMIIGRNPERLGFKSAPSRE